MAKRRIPNVLTREEWLAKMPPVYYLKISFPSWREIEHELALKKAALRASGWIYTYPTHNGQVYTFEKLADYTVFKLWAQDEPFADGELAIE